MKDLIIFGSTGSIGTQTLDIVRRNPDKFRVSALTCNRRIHTLESQIDEFHPEAVCVGSEELAAAVQDKYPGLQVLYGSEGLAETAEIDADMAVSALMGISGLKPTYTAIMTGKDIALANKETMVTGGRLINEAVRENGVKLLPVDSEHSAIFQCLQSRMGSDVRRIILTASGGPFRGYSLKQLEDVTLEQALNHPKWKMGRKITVDSATMMNKGLEVIEARWLFDVDPSRIQVHVHPESIVHSAVEFEDRSVIAQMGIPDMRIPIGLALNYPDRLPWNSDDSDESLDLFAAGELHFEKPDLSVFRCLDLAYQALEEGGGATVLLNGANEELVGKFLRGEIRFIDIQRTLEKVMSHNVNAEPSSVDDILELDSAARKIADEEAQKIG